MHKPTTKLFDFYGILVYVTTSFVCVDVAVKRKMYQRKDDVDVLNAVNSVLNDVSRVALRQSKEGIKG